MKASAAFFCYMNLKVVHFGHKKSSCPTYAIVLHKHFDYSQKNGQTMSIDLKSCIFMSVCIFLCLFVYFYVYFYCYVNFPFKLVYFVVINTVQM